MISVMNIPRFFFIMVRSSPNHSHERPNQSLASIHWLTYKPTVFGAVVVMSSVMGVCGVLSVLTACAAGSMWLIVCDGKL